jgi:hypothetical protein
LSAKCGIILKQFAWTLCAVVPESGESAEKRPEDTTNPRQAEIKNQTGGYYNGSSINEAAS